MKPVFALLCLLGTIVGCSLPAEQQEKPNIIFIMADDLGWADLGVYGQDAYRTPHLDRMAEEGIRFTQAYSGNAVCAPSRSSLMTGQHAGHTPVRGNTGGIPLPDEAVTIAEVLRDAGYQTAGFGKWGLGDLDSEGVPERQGFDTFFGYYHQIHAHYYFTDYLINNGEKIVLPGNEGFYDIHPRQGAISEESDGMTRQFSHHVIFDKMKEWIRAHHDAPFFVYAPWTPPHGRFEILEDDPAWQAVRDQPWPEGARVRAAFNIMIDRSVGEILSLLEELGIDDETIVFFASDNGAGVRHDGILDSSGPLRGRKLQFYEGGIRVPFIVRWPGHIAPGQVSQVTTYFPDVFPTLADLAGAGERVLEDVDGRSILSVLLHQSDAPVHDYLYWESPSFDWGTRRYGTLAQAVRHGKWKLVRHDEAKPWELYDLEEDVREQNDVAEQYPEVVKELEDWIYANRTAMPPQIEPEQAEGREYR